MSDQNLETQVAMLAVSAAGAINGDVRAWQTRVAEYTSLIAVMLKPPTEKDRDLATTPVVQARKALESKFFQAEFVDFEEEPNTHRLIVRFKSETQADNETESDGTEHLRTEPRWTRAGWVMQSLVKRLSPGQRCHVHKYVEEIDNGRKKVRVIAHLDPIGRPPERQAQQPAPDRTAPRPPDGAERGAAVSPPTTPAAPESPATHGPHYEAVRERFDKLSPTQRVALKALCRAKGVAGNFMDPSHEDVDKVMLALGELEKED